MLLKRHYLTEVRNIFEDLAKKIELQDFISLEDYRLLNFDQLASEKIAATKFRVS